VLRWGATKETTYERRQRQRWEDHRGLLPGGVDGCGGGPPLRACGGKETREFLSEKAREGREKAAEAARQTREALARQRETISSAIERGREAYREARDKETA